MVSSECIPTVEGRKKILLQQSIVSFETKWTAIACQRTILLRIDVIQFCFWHLFSGVFLKFAYKRRNSYIRNIKVVYKYEPFYFWCIQNVQQADWLLLHWIWSTIFIIKNYWKYSRKSFETLNFLCPINK